MFPRSASGSESTHITIPAQAGNYWNGEAMKTVNYNDLDKTPDAVASTTASMAANATHLARLLAKEQYPAS
ncbi:hypothetical protein [Microbacterium sp. STN6]|uniref:hypothetical protein n=1 Tax=Microbacterium sp. STN6 TaxID=2995588 RepID=UPI002B21331A|nr:hypothetical protein [Microbacterium sp. STN6]